ncbi:helix-turn-helix domain-containing protein [Bradyrhizobium sp. CCBAU 21359]|uniref:helix-turn-helix domain-containing protein n=1 Tax=Bradyrhizobium sp. CCBAU 21359 TaxID=1325080 RepID=UPI002305A339|nr:helix-turn-helix transcriptional regulator [Bradyrhizobium sp. CCBAU 21359]
MRRIRLERGIPQEQLANDAGIYRSYMGCIEQKKENPTIELLDRIAVPSGVHLSELFAEPVKDATPPSPTQTGAPPVRTGGNYCESDVSANAGRSEPERPTCFIDLQPTLPISCSSRCRPAGFRLATPGAACHKADS